MSYLFHLGIDLQKRFAYWVLLSEEKKVLWRGRVETSASAVRAALSRLPVVREETCIPSQMLVFGLATVLSPPSETMSSCGVEETKYCTTNGITRMAIAMR